MNAIQNKEGRVRRGGARARWDAMYDSAEFQALRVEYMEGVLQRRERIAEAVDRLTRSEPIDLKQLRQEIHKIRGSGGFYGFPDLSKAAGAAEDHLVLVLDGELERDDATIAKLVQQVVVAIEKSAAEMGMK